MMNACAFVSVALLVTLGVAQWLHPAPSETGELLFNLVGIALLASALEVHGSRPDSQFRWAWFWTRPLPGPVSVNAPEVYAGLLSLAVAVVIGVAA